MAEPNSPTYPTIGESNWWAIRNQFAKSLPSSINVAYLKSLLQLNSEKSAKNLIYPLQKLGIIDLEGKTTDRANEWRHDATYQSACQQMIDSVYPSQLRELYSGKDIDRKALEGWFQYTGKLGASTARQAAATYLLLNNATPKSLSETTKRNKPPINKSTVGAPLRDQKSNPTKPTPPTPLVKAEPIKTDNDSILPSVTKTNPNKDWFSLHVDLQIHISPEATAEQIDQIFASMAKHIVAMKTSD